MSTVCFVGSKLHRGRLFIGVRGHRGRTGRRVVPVGDGDGSVTALRRDDE
jgi:hypothetical protein